MDTTLSSESDRKRLAATDERIFSFARS